ncbi:MAG: sulfatase [Bacteroidales bacterium]|jgi:arylsulfatase A-like enzyme|nr:sulfatase [Bacteroidales bacterium]
MKINHILYMNLVGMSCWSSLQAKAPRPNILFICVDDFRPEAGFYQGTQYVKTPHLDRLAASGVSFSNHYCSVPTSGASRHALLTGQHPRTRQALNNEASSRLISGQPETERPETFIHHLRRNGYYTVGAGKISHSADGYVYGYTEPKSALPELPYSWDEMLFDPGKWGTGWNAFFACADGSNRQSRKNQVKPYECGDVDDDGYPDGLTARVALDKLDELAAGDQPFFLGVGFFKPHLPFNAPKKYWDMYDESALPLTPVPGLPLDVARESLHESGEFASYRLGDEEAGLDHPVSDAYARKLRHAYFACISYTDAQIGKLLDRLDSLGLRENTVIVVWGDHGWHLGDFRIWGKHTLFDRALRSTLLISAPQTTGRGDCRRIVSSVDLYPTLMDLCHIPLPYAMDGQSLKPFLNRPALRSEKAAYGYFKQGITVRTERYRLTKYAREASPVVELYDHKTDPHESRNIAGTHQKLVARLMRLLEKGDTGLYR